METADTPFLSPDNPQLLIFIKDIIKTRQIARGTEEYPTRIHLAMLKNVEQIQKEQKELNDYIKLKENLHVEEKFQFSIEGKGKAKVFDLLAKDKEVEGI